jgi:hypothetical protein
VAHPEVTGRKIPSRMVQQRYSVSDRTLDRWLRDPKMGFPEPVYINRRRYFEEAELDDFDRAAARRVAAGSAA